MIRLLNTLRVCPYSRLALQIAWPLESRRVKQQVIMMLLSYQIPIKQQRVSAVYIVVVCCIKNKWMHSNVNVQCSCSFPDFFWPVWATNCKQLIHSVRVACTVSIFGTIYIISCLLHVYDFGRREREGCGVQLGEDATGYCEGNYVTFSSCVFGDKKQVLSAKTWYFPLPLTVFSVSRPNQIPSGWKLNLKEYNVAMSRSVKFEKMSGFQEIKSRFILGRGL